MKKILLVLVISFYAHTAWALTIATGPSDGSYFQIAQDIKNVAGKDGIDLQVMPTKGSLENLELLGSGKVDLAIVQLDALRFISDVIKKDSLTATAGTSLTSMTSKRRFPRNLLKKRLRRWSKAVWTRSFLWEERLCLLSENSAANLVSSGSPPIRCWNRSICEPRWASSSTVGPGPTRRLMQSLPQ